MQNDECFDLAAWRNRMGYTQDQAAEALGMGRTTYQHSEYRRNFSLCRPQPVNRRTILACKFLEALRNGYIEPINAK